MSPIIKHGYAQRQNKDSAKRAHSRRIVIGLARMQDHPVCPLCSLPMLPSDTLEADHIIPVSAGGSDEVWNLRAVHKTCNRKRGTG